MNEPVGRKTDEFTFHGKQSNSSILVSGKTSSDVTVTFLAYDELRSELRESPVFKEKGQSLSLDMTNLRCKT